MTNSDEWKIAKWLVKHGPTKRSNVPVWFPHGLTGKYLHFHVEILHTDSDGYPQISEDDIFSVSEQEMDSFRATRKAKIHEFRDWLEPAGVIGATIISLIALIRTFIT